MDETPKRGRLYHFLKFSNHGAYDRSNARRHVGLSSLRRTRVVRRFLDLREKPEIMNIQIHDVMYVASFIIVVTYCIISNL